jgi:hypothetical protein
MSGYPDPTHVNRPHRFPVRVQASPPWHTMLHYPGCRRAVTALVPTITSMGDLVSGHVRDKVHAWLHLGTRFIGYHISRHVLSTFKSLTQVSTH